jgi:hypothetical protein
MVGEVRADLEDVDRGGCACVTLPLCRQGARSAVLSHRAARVCGGGRDAIAAPAPHNGRRRLDSASTKLDSEGGREGGSVPGCGSPRPTLVGRGDGSMDRLLHL